MNIQDIADFLDLVKNPEKYESKIGQLVDEQKRLEALIASVGEIGEIQTIKRDLEAKVAQQDIDYATKMEQIRSDRLIEKQANDAATLALNAAKAEFEMETKELKSQKAALKSVEKQVKEIELAVSKKLEALTITQSEMEVLKSEYESKLAAIKAAVG